MLLATGYWGWADETEIAGLVHGRDLSDTSVSERVELRATKGTWLETTRKQVKSVPKYPFDVPPGGLPRYLQPAIWAVLFGVLIGFVNLVVLW